jgi:hypothetical protein
MFEGNSFGGADNAADDDDDGWIGKSRSTFKIYLFD